MQGKKFFDRILMIVLLLSVFGGGAALVWLQTGGPYEPEAATEQGAKQAVVMQATLPDAVFMDSFGLEKRLSDFKGQVVLVNLWATWCPPCVDELPSLERLETRLRDQGLVVAAISLDKPPFDAVDDFLQKRDILQLSVYRDGKKEVQMKWKYKGLPSSFLVGRDGKVVKVYEGAQVWDDGAVFNEIRALLK